MKAMDRVGPTTAFVKASKALYYRLTQPRRGVAKFREYTNADFNLNANSSSDLEVPLTEAQLDEINFERPANRPYIRSKEEGIAYSPPTSPMAAIMPSVEEMLAPSPSHSR